MHTHSVTHTPFANASFDFSVHVHLFIVQQQHKIYCSTQLFIFHSIFILPFFVYCPDFLCAKPGGEKILKIENEISFQRRENEKEIEKLVGDTLTCTPQDLFFFLRSRPLELAIGKHPKKFKMIFICFECTK